jgi:hypothetical protein
MKGLLIIWALLFILGDFNAGQTFDYLGDDTELVYSGISGTNTMLVTRVSNGIPVSYMIFSVPTRTNVFTRSIYGKQYTFEVLSNQAVRISRNQGGFMNGRRVRG